MSSVNDKIKEYTENNEVKRLKKDLYGIESFLYDFVHNPEDYFVSLMNEIIIMKNNSIVKYICYIEIEFCQKDFDKLEPSKVVKQLEKHINCALAQFKLKGKIDENRNFKFKEKCVHSLLKLDKYCEISNCTGYIFIDTEKLYLCLPFFCIDN